MTDETQENVDIPETAETEVSEEQPKEKNKIQERIDKITQQKYEAMQERDLLKKQLEDLKSQQPEPQQQQEPTLESFDYDEQAYNDARIASEAQKAAKQMFDQYQQQQTDQQKEQQFLAQAREFAAREAKFAAQVEDYDKLTKNDYLPINETMADFIRSAETGPAINYYLAKHPDEAYQIANMDQIGAQRALLRIESSFQKPNHVSSAPDPVPDIGGSEVPIVDWDNLPNDEWQKRRRKQVYGK